MPIIAFPHGASIPAIQRTLEALAPNNAPVQGAAQSRTGLISPTAPAAVGEGRGAPTSSAWELWTE